MMKEKIKAWQEKYEWFDVASRWCILWLVSSAFVFGIIMFVIGVLLLGIETLKYAATLGGLAGVVVWGVALISLLIGVGFAINEYEEF